VHCTAAGGLCLQVCVKTSSPPTSGLRALNSCHKVSAIAQTCGGAERLPVSHLSVSVISPVSHTRCLFTGPETGTIEVCLVTHHISYGVWSPVEGGGSFSQTIWPGQLDPEKVPCMAHSPQLLHTQIVVKDFCGTRDIIQPRESMSPPPQQKWVMCSGVSPQFFKFFWTPVHQWGQMRENVNDPHVGNTEVTIKIEVGEVKSFPEHQ